MTFLEINDSWAIASTVATIAATLVALIYTFITLKIFRQNKNANKLSAYLELRKELTNDIFTLVTAHCQRNTINIDNTNSVRELAGYKISDGVLQINKFDFTRYVLGSLEDLALFYENKILSIQLIDSGYGYSILYIGNNESVRSLLKELRSTANVYNGFENIYAGIFKRLSNDEKRKYKDLLIDKT